MNLIEQAKAHPYIAAGVGVVGVLAAYMILGGGGGDGSGYNGDNVTAATGAQTAQNQMQAALAGIAADLQKTMGAQSAAITAEQIRAQSTFDIAQLSAGLGYAQIDATKQISTAQIMASEKATREETRRLEVTTSGQIAMQQLLTDTINNQTNAQARVAMEGYKPHGLFSFIFG